MRYWTGREERQLIEMHRRGLSIQEIADFMGRTRRSASMRILHLRKHGVDLTPRQTRWTKEQLSRLLFLFHAGETVRIIADEIGRSYQATRTMITELRRSGVDLPRRRPRLRGRTDG